LFHKFFDEGYETVRDVIVAKPEDLVTTFGLEREKIDEILAMLKKGLEEAEIEDEEDIPPSATAVAAKKPEASDGGTTEPTATGAGERAQEEKAEEKTEEKAEEKTEEKTEEKAKE
ncbi:MAG: hypothetical protein AAB330_04140, partial [Bacteroidota bacterium]